MGLDLAYTGGQTLLDPNELAGLKIDSITTRAELDEFEQQNIEEALLWLYRRRLTVEQLLSAKFIKQLHVRMYGNVWKWAGQFRLTNKNIGVQYPLVGMELYKLLDDMKYWLEYSTYDEDEFCIRSKHRLVSIHCFPNGNGRHSRLWADILRQQLFGRSYFTWSGHSLANASQHRSQYIASLRSADQGDLLPLVTFAKSR